MNKNKKRQISPGKFNRIANMAVYGMRVNAFTVCTNDVIYAAYVVGNFMYWSERKMKPISELKKGAKYYRKSLSEALA